MSIKKIFLLFLIKYNNNTTNNYLQFNDYKYFKIKQVFFYKKIINTQYFHTFSVL